MVLAACGIALHAGGSRCFEIIFYSALFDTTPRTVRRLNEPALGSAQQDSHLPRISRAAPIACICGWTGCLFRADGIIARQIAASAFGWVSIALHLKGRSLTSDFLMQVVFAHPPHRCSPSSGGRQPTLFVAGYDCRGQCFSRFRQAVILGLCSL